MPNLRNLAEALLHFVFETNCGAVRAPTEPKAASKDNYSKSVLFVKLGVDSASPCLGGALKVFYDGEMLYLEKHSVNFCQDSSFFISTSEGYNEKVL